MVASKVIGNLVLEIPCQVDGEVVTLEIPNSLLNMWEKHPDFASYCKSSSTAIRGRRFKNGGRKPADPSKPQVKPL